MNRYYQRFRVRGYERKTVTVGERTETRWEYRDTESGIMEEGSDPLKIALVRNNSLLACDRFEVDAWPAFKITITDGRGEGVQERRRRFRLRRQDPKYNEFNFGNLGPYWEDPETWL